MIDEVKLEYSFHNSNELHSLLNRPEFGFYPGKPHPFTKDVIRFNGEYKNLRLSISLLTSKLYVSNSVHKLAKGENHSTLTRREGEFALEEFSESIKIELENFYVRKVATGLNILVAETPLNYINLPLTYRNKYFQNVITAKTNKVIERACEMSEKRIKFYDKGEQFYITSVPRQRLMEPNIVRFETVYRERSAFPALLKKVELRANMLFSEAFISTMGTELLITFDKIDKNIPMEYSKLKPTEIILLSSFQIPSVVDGMKRFHPDSYEQYRKLYLKLKKELQPSDNKVKEMRAKFEQEIEKILED